MYIYIYADRIFTVPQKAHFLHIDMMLRCAQMGWGGVGLVTTVFDFVAHHLACYVIVFFLHGTSPACTPRYVPQL